MTLTRAEVRERLRKGTTKTDTVDAPELDGELAVRGLTQAEVDEVNGLALKGQQVSGLPGEKPTELNLDLGTSATAAAAANRAIAAHGLSVDSQKWTPKDAGELPPATFRRVLAKAKELTGPDAFFDEIARSRAAARKPGGGGDADKGDLAAARSFRDDDGGPDDRAAAPDRGAAGDHTG